MRTLACKSVICGSAGRRCSVTFVNVVTVFS